MLDRASITTLTTLSEEAVRDISQELMPLLADVFALYLKTKNFHWHMSGPHFRDYHLMLDDQGDQLFAHDGRHCRTGTEAGRHNRLLHRADFAFSASSRQRC